mmetsp:Transcript_22770/g.73268  ORF Transcript_22770/g.73268 Transcript_22770/m.73268 type:complete len:234 (-) Transcript_22770:667-1368(-)
MMHVSFGTRAQETAITILAPSLAMPPFSYLRPTMNPVMFCRNSSGMPRWEHSSMKCAPFTALSLNRIPLLATMPTGLPYRRAKPVTREVPYMALNSSKREPSTMRAITLRTSNGFRVSAGMTPPSSLASNSGSSDALATTSPCARPFRLATIRRAMASACASSSAKWSVTPLMRQCTSAPPRSSALTTSPVAALTSGGPPRKMVPFPLTMTDSSDMAGTYAPPAVQLPMTTAI